MPTTRPLVERFAEKVRFRSTPDGCDEWTATLSHHGYGQIGATRERKLLYAHRVAWELVNGPIPAAMVVMHACDNPRCVRVDHLRLGTQAENNADRDAKGRRVDGWARRTHCKHGHEYTPENTWPGPKNAPNSRRCRACTNARCLKRYHDRKARELAHG
jgi:hypothetical protein